VALTLIYGYLAIALLTALLAGVFSARVGRREQPAGHRVMLSAAAGLLWPLMLLGLLEFTSVAAFAKVSRTHHGAGMDVFG
jgi:MFS family permease